MMESGPMPSSVNANNNKSVNTKRKLSGKAQTSAKKKKKRVNEELTDVKTDVVKTHSTDDNHIVINRTLPVVSKKKLKKEGSEAGKKRIKNKSVTLREKRFQNGKLWKAKKKLKVADANDNKTSETTLNHPLTSPLFSEVNIREESSERDLQLPMEALPISVKIKPGLKKSLRMGTEKITKKSKGIRKNSKHKLDIQPRTQCMKSLLSSVNVEKSEIDLEMPKVELPTLTKTEIQHKECPRLATGKVKKKSKRVKKNSKQKLDAELRKQCEKAVLSQVNVKKEVSEIGLEVPAEELAALAASEIQHKKSPRMAGAKISKKSKLVKKNRKRKVSAESGKHLNKPISDQVNERTESSEIPVEELPILAKIEIGNKKSTTGKITKKSRRVRRLSTTKKAEKAQDEHTEESIIKSDEPISNDSTSTANRLKPRKRGKKRLRRSRRSAKAKGSEHVPLITTPTERSPQSSTLSKAKRAVKERVNPINGQVCKAVVIGQRNLYLIIRLNFGPEGRIHVSQIEEEVRPGTCPLSKFQPNQEIEVVLVKRVTQKPIYQTTNRWAKTVWDCTLLPRPEGATKIFFRKKFKVGQKVVAFIKSIKEALISVSIAPGVNGVVLKMELSKELQDVSCLKNYFSFGHGHKATVIEKLKSSYSLSFLDPEDLTIGSVVLAKFTYSQPNLGMIVKLPCNYKGTVSWPDVSDEYLSAREYLSALEEHAIFQCCILGVDHQTKCAVVSLRQSRVSKTAAAVVDKEINTIDELHENYEVRGYVKNQHYNTLYVTVGRDVEVCAAVWPEVPVYFLTSGNVVKLRITKIIREKMKVMGNLILPDDVEMNEVVEYSSKKQRRQKVQLSENRTQDTDDSTLNPSDVKKLPTQNKERLCEDHKNFKNAPLTPKPVVIKNCSVKEGSIAPHLNVSSGFVWDENVHVNADTTRHNDSSDEESEDDDKLSSKRKNKKKRISDRVAEQQLFEREKLLMDGTRLPETVDDFDRLVLSSPNSSLIWLKYMSFHLQSAEIEKARAVGERALKTISFREEREKLNVWTALLNLENLYGTPESLDEMLRRSVQYNDPLTVYNRLVNIYIKTDKLEAAEQLYKTMVKRFNKNKEVWINFGIFLMRNGQYQAAQKLMEQSFLNLPAREHVGIISKFAQLEFKFGEAQRGRTMLESVLSSYPTRTDVWSVYFDMVYRVERNLEEARQLFERAITMQLSAKKMKFFFKRYLEFEKEHGTEATVERVMKKAEEFVENHDVPMDIDSDDR